MRMLYALILAMLAANVHVYADSPLRVKGAAEMFLYTEAGYTATFPASPGPQNASSYGLRFTTEARATRVPRIFLFEDALLLLGDSTGRHDVKRSAQPTSVLARYGVGLDVRRNVQIRLTHGEGYDFGGPKTVGSPWNSVSVRFERRVDRFVPDDYVEVHLYPPHNEYDPNPVGAFAQRAVARYGLQFGKRVSIGRKQKIFVFTEPLLLFGDSRPQIDYNYSAKPLAGRLSYGAGFAIRSSLQLRFTQAEWRNLGGYRGQSQGWNGISLRYRW